MSSDYPARVRLREVGPRDGFQNIHAFIPTERKLACIRALADAGLREIEVTSFVNAKVIPQMADAEAVMAGLRDADFIRSVLVPTLKRAEEAISAGADQLIVFLSASEAHNRANVNRSIAESLAGLDTIFRLAADARVGVVGAVAVAFGCPYDGRVDAGAVLDIAAAFKDAGSAGLIFGDTTGMANPASVTAFVEAYRARFGSDDYSLHFHNNRGTAMANLLAAMAAGASTFDTALGGTGGCPTVPKAAGNLATEDVVALLDEIGVETGADLQALIAAARELEQSLGYELPGQVMKSGPCDWHVPA
ncbi:MAG: hydroxymethylglutaryl-CoA lyase [Rhodospirillaceae bacterium]